MVYNSRSSWLSSFLFFPGRCLCCGANSFTNQDLCEHCKMALPWQEYACPRCALPLPAPSSSPCGECQRRRPSFQQSLAAFRYEAPVNRLITRFKHQDGQACGRLLSELFCEWLPSHIDWNTTARPDYLLPVPLHWTHLWQRGFNQAEWFARDLSRRYNIPCLTDALIRKRSGVAQQSLRREQRLKNLQNIFQIRPKHHSLFINKHIVVIDDVITTGATVENISRLLKDAGAASISVWALARTPK
jgi:ComF family protein